MFKKNILKSISTLLAVIFVLSCGITNIAFADEPLEPTPAAIDIHAQYVHNESADTYTITFASKTDLPSLKKLSFAITANEERTISAASFSSALYNGTATASISPSVATFTNGADSTAISGKLELCSITISAGTGAPTDTSIAFSNITAENSEGTPVTYTPTVVVTDQPVIPVLTEKEKSAYDKVVALPSIDTLSFYTTEAQTELADLTALSNKIDLAKTEYDALTTEELARVTQTLDYYGLSAEGIPTLKTAVDNMKKVTDAMRFAFTLKSIPDSNILRYRFLTNIYTSEVVPAITESAPTFTEGSAIKAQYEAATNLISTKQTLMDTKFAEIGTTDSGYEQKITLLTNQLELVQSLSADTFYTDFRDNLKTQANDLKTVLADYPVEITKNALIAKVDEFLTKISLIENGIATPPTAEMPAKINKRYNYSVSLSRPANVAIAASVKVDVYAEDDLEHIIDTKTETFLAGQTNLEVSLFANQNTYPSNKNVTVYVYYIIEGGSLLVDTLTSYSYNTPSKAPSLGSNLDSNSNSNNSDKDKDTSGGTKFPSPNEDDYKDEDDEIEIDNASLFNDIKNYGWAKEAIEGLYYTGIINGMEEGVFNPAGNVTREQFCKMVVQLFGVLNHDISSSFGDVKTDAWYAPYINSAIQAGYVQGQSADYFGVGESIMRQDMATIIYRALGSKNSAAVLDFTDNDSIAPYAEEAISELVGLKVLSGYEDGSFNPRGTATRAEAAKVIWGVYQIIK